MFVFIVMYQAAHAQSAGLEYAITHSALEGGFKSMTVENDGRVCQESGFAGIPQFNLMTALLRKGLEISKTGKGNSGDVIKEEEQRRMNQKDTLLLIYPNALPGLSF
ncbi:MAG: hypothetical protein PHN88_03615 [Ignavibacteria bacterium]|nr:hypothetical protein [Ignavibacteria bacterium]